MSRLVSIIMFWIVVIVAVRLAVLFPQSLLARVLFYRIGPTPRRRESEADYLLRWVRACVGWFAQAALLFGAGWLWFRLDAARIDSLFFAALWLVVVPLLAVSALSGALLALARWLWVHYSERLPATAVTTERPPGIENDAANRTRRQHVDR
jgi:hypothetical protein